MTLPETIQKAIDGGWYPPDIEKHTHTEHHQFCYAQWFNEKTLLDPNFWKALGKVLRWRKMYKIQEGWLYQWHQFIDHIAEGKSIESFFLQF